METASAVLSVEELKNRVENLEQRLQGVDGKLADLKKLLKAIIAE